MAVQQISSLPIATPAHTSAQLLDSPRNNFLLDIPLPVVNFSRTVYAVSLILAIVLQQPLITSVLLIIVSFGVIGARWNILGRLGRAIFRKQITGNPAVPLEDARLIRFNNLIVVGLLTVAQIAFWIAQIPLVGWIITGGIVAASIGALAGFCIGCTIFYRFRLHKYNLFKTL